MNVVSTAGLEERHLERIRAIEGVEIEQPADSEAVLVAMPQAEVVMGSLSNEMFIRGERLRWVQTASAGVDGMLSREFVESEVLLTSAKGTVGVHLAEQAMALLLALTRGISWAIRKPNWHQRMPIRHAAWELVDRTMGLVGLGGTGRDLAQRAAGFGMRILAVDPEAIDIPDCVEACWKMDRFNDLLEASDVVAVCAPLTPETKDMFDREAFSLMRSHAILINVTRGGIVEESALLEALEKGTIGGAGLDVTPEEPLPKDHPLWTMENVVVTPHVAGGSPNRLDRLTDLFCENLRRYMGGEELLSVIDKRKGY